MATPDPQPALSGPAAIAAAQPSDPREHMTLTPDAAVPAFLRGGGEMGALIRAFDWSSHPLGPPAAWPQPLRTAIRLTLNTRHPAYVFWGDAAYCFYNDAYSPSTGAERHPASLGRPAREIWGEIWPVIGPQIEQVMRGDGATWHENQRIPMTRDGRLDEIWWTYSFSPIDDEDAVTGVGGVLVLCNETTGEVLAERRLTEERERQRQMLRQMPGFAAILTGPTHVFVYVNDAYVATAGDRQFVGRPVRDVFPDLAGQGFFELLDRVYASGEPYAARALPVRLDRDDGDRFIDMLYAPIRDDAGAVTGIFVGGYDVTEREHALARLRTSEARGLGVLEGMDEGFVLLDANFRLIEINAEALRLEGRPREDLIGRLHWEVWPNPDDAALTRQLRHAMTAREAVQMENHYIWPDGRDGWFDVRIYPAGDGLAIFYRDVTPRRESEAALREAEERLRLATEHAEIGYWDVDPVNDVLIWPPRTKAMFGISPDVSVGMQDFYDGLHPDDLAKTSEAYARAADPALRALYDVEYRTIGKEDGLVRWIAAKGRGVFDAEARCIRVAGTAIEITARREAEERLRELNETLEARVAERTAALEAAHEQLRQSQKLEAMGSLTGGVAHDFNNLLTPIVGALDVLQRREVGGERERRLIAGAAQSADRAKTLVQRLLAFARRQPLQSTAVDVGVVATGIADLLRSTTGPQIKLVVDVAPGLPPAVADANQLEMALLNLGVNARDAMTDGGTLRITAGLDEVADANAAKLPAGRYLRVSVADTGVGMTPETAARAIEPFFSTKGVGKGTGLGLSMVHGLAAQLGGALAIQSHVGVGTNIELWLPASDALVAAHETTANGAAPATRTGTVLLVDDEELVRLSTADLLADLGYDVVEAESAEAALRLMADGLAPDLIVTDHLMPGMSGTDLAHRVRAERSRMPILVVSGYAESEGIAPDLPRLTKPFRRDDLVHALEGLTALAKP